MTEAEVVPSYEESRRRSILLPPGNSGSEPVPPSLAHHYFKNEELGIEFSSHATSSTSIPVFHPHSVIEGNAILTLAKERTLQKISVAAECGVQLGALDSAYESNSAYDHGRFKPFWSTTTVVFPPEQSSRKKTNLPAGTHAFPFRLEIPKSSKPFHRKFFGSAESILPPNFVDPGIPYTIQYVLLAEVKYGFLKIDRILHVLFRHIPIIGPNYSPSPAIMRAYLLGDPMPTPSADPLGYLQESVVIAGTLFSRPFTIDCQFFLPRPTAYTIGTRINFFLKVASSPNEEETAANTQAADLLLLPNSTSIYLEQLVQTSGRFSGDFTENIATAKTWQRRDEMDGRLLQGEILLSTRTKADFSFPCIGLFHQVVLGICAPGVIISTIKPPISRNQRLPSSSRQQTVLFVPVRLVNASRTGDPEPPSYVPVPTYSVEPEPSSPGPPRSPLTVQARCGLFQGFY